MAKGSNPPPRGPDGRTRTLSRIADALGVPPAALLDPADASPLARGADLIRLWSAIEGDGDRERVLTFARGIVRRQERRG